MPVPIRRLALLLAVLLTSMASAQPAPTTVRVELEAAPADPSWFALAAPDRLVIDFPGGRTRAAKSEGRGPARALRLAQHDRATARLVIDLAEPARLLSARRETGAVTLTLAPTTPADFARLARGGRFSIAAAVPPAPRPLVVIDPGHGGRDVGAISPHGGGYEKDVTFAIARAAAEAINAGGVARAELTRDDDRFLPLGERPAIARRRGAALFISVHADSAPNAAARGASVYTLSEVASDAMAARLAARENRADALAGINLGGEEPEVAAILYDLARRRATNASADYAQTLAAALAPDVPVTGRFHRFAGFRVLKSADMPAVLLETGFLSNADDARFLFSPAGQKAIARGLTRSVALYFAPRATPPAAVAAR